MRVLFRKPLPRETDHELSEVDREGPVMDFSSMIETVQPAAEPSEGGETLAEKMDRLRRCLGESAPLVVAYSGGVDSAYLLAEAVALLGDDALAVIADSPSLPRKALEDAVGLARKIGARLEVVRTAEMDDPNYASNPINRCYFCKAELFARLDDLARSRGFRAIAYGENADDMRQERPGRKAATAFSVIAPLRDAGLTKSEIRHRSRELGLPTADAPAQPCLSSRIPHGTPVTPEALAMIERGEEWVRGLGFSIFRVRHLVGPDGIFTARVQVAPEEMGRVAAVNGAITGGLMSVGYHRVEIDPHGYRSGAA
jgi:uncharacterized protein